ncbi:MAG: orotidine-5'-phosphate decarboxylase [Verrucomicrobiae bacterium]|nr:orotidine-5'-phosphate decarboxylase [Verrucomicrobiae bacterium]
MNSSTTPLSPIIIALDVDTSAEAVDWVQRLGKQADIFKVGLQLFIKEGMSVVEAIIAQGKRVFVDLKLHDIPNTVHHATLNLMRPGVEFITLHAGGGVDMMEAAVEAAAENRAKSPTVTAKLLGVTVLTSLDEDDLREIGINHSVSGQVMNLARLAVEAGVDGLVTSPKEVRLLRQEHREKVVLVTPGIRPAGGDTHDQKRVMTPAEAILEGSNYLVMGRSLLDSPAPEKTLEEILASLRR